MKILLLALLILGITGCNENELLKHEGKVIIKKEKLSNDEGYILCLEDTAYNVSVVKVDEANYKYNILGQHYQYLIN